jgi:hypothetical protein
MKSQHSSRNTTGLKRGWAWVRENRREGRRQRAVRRLLIAANGQPVTTPVHGSNLSPRRAVDGMALARRSHLSPALIPR